MPSNHKRSAPGPRVVNGPAGDPATESATAEPAEQQQQQQTSPQQPRPGARRSGEGLNIGELKDMSIQKLTQVAKDLNVAGATGMRKQDLIFQIL